jgi:hypothetical protein
VGLKENTVPLLPAVLDPYAKAVVPFVVGVILVVVGVIVNDDTLRQLGLGALGSSPLVYAANNQPT